MPLNELNTDGVFFSGIAFMVLSFLVGILIRLYVAKQRSKSWADHVQKPYPIKYNGAFNFV